MRTLKRAQDVRKQLLGIMDRHRLDVVSCGKSTSRVQKTICSGKEIAWPENKQKEFTTSP
jgi:ATP-dependent RNA helicase DHX8/PRP22